MLEDIAQLRRERNAEMAEYYEGIDESESTNTNNEVEETAKWFCGYLIQIVPRFFSRVIHK